MLWTPVNRLDLTAYKHRAASASCWIPIGEYMEPPGKERIKLVRIVHSYHDVVYPADWRYGFFYLSPSVDAAKCAKESNHRNSSC